MTADWIEWPPGCDPSKHFPSRRGRLNVSDPRVAKTFWTAVGGGNATREALNIPLYSRKKHTRESIEAEIREHFTKTGKRPFQKELSSQDQWLRARGSSLHLLCDDLGLPGGLVLNRTLESVEADIREFFTKTGKRPTEYDLNRQHQWLKKRGSSLPKLCDELGLPGGRVFNRTRESVEAEVREFFTKTGKRPSQKDMTDQEAWLRKRSSSLSRLCDELGLPKATQGRHAK